MKRKFILCLLGMFLVLSLTVLINEANASERADDTRATIATGEAVSFAIQSDGSLWAWGLNNQSQLGDGTTTDRPTPVRILDDVIAVSTGSSHTMAIRNDGSLWAWGTNAFGQLGTGTTTNRHSPARVMEDVTAVSVGQSYTMALKTDGSLWGWGRNGAGQLGNGTTADHHLPERIMSDVIAVSAGSSHTMVIRNDGSLWAWGANAFGQLGDGTTTARHSPERVMEDVVAVSAGGSHTAAIKTDGSLWTWGANVWGQLGDGTATGILFGDGTNAPRSIPVRVMENVSTVSAGDNYTMAIRNDGTLWAWGSNLYGVLGDGSGRPTSTPLLIMEDVVYVSTTSFTTSTAMMVHTMAIKTDGSLWAWGHIYHGQLGFNMGEFGSGVSEPVHIMDNIMLLGGEVLPSAVTATPTQSPVLVNGDTVAFQAYHISGNNFFRLRDIAYILNGTSAQFNVEWDAANNAILLTSGAPYTTVGGEMPGAGTGPVTATPTRAAVLLDGEPVNLRAYHIGGNNFFMLRDLGAVLGFRVDWDEAARAVLINTD